MSDRIEQAARIIREGIEDVRDEPHLSDAEHAKMVAEVLAESGLLATREEWATRDESDSPADSTGWKGATVGAKDETQARDRAWSFGYAVYRRYVTEWQAVE